MMGPIGSFYSFMGLMTHRFLQVNGGQRDPRVLGCHNKELRILAAAYPQRKGIYWSMTES